MAWDSLPPPFRILRCCLDGFWRPHGSRGKTGILGRIQREKNRTFRVFTCRAAFPMPFGDSIFRCTFFTNLATTPATSGGDIFRCTFLPAAFGGQRPPGTISCFLRFHLPLCLTGDLRWRYLAFYVFTCRVRRATTSGGDIFLCVKKDIEERHAKGLQSRPLDSGFYTGVWRGDVRTFLRVRLGAINAI